MASALQTPLPGLADPVFDAQSIFRVVLDALSRPGRIAALPIDIVAPSGLMKASAGIALCLVDSDTPVWLDATLRTPEIESYLRFHTGCAITTDPQAAAIAILANTANATEIAAFPTGTAEYPDRSTTIIVQTRGLDDSQGVRLRGPGIETEHLLEIVDTDSDFWDVVMLNNAQFPLGVDFLLAADNQLVGLPRSVCPVLSVEGV